MKRRLEISGPAKKDIRAIWTYFRSKAPAKGKSVVEAVLAAGRQLLVFPESGRSGRVEGTRELVVVQARYKYIVVYQLHEGGVTVLRVLHHAQQWPTIA